MEHSILRGGEEKEREKEEERKREGRGGVGEEGKLGHCVSSFTSSVPCNLPSPRSKKEGRKLPYILFSPPSMADMHLHWLCCKTMPILVSLSLSCKSHATLCLSNSLYMCSVWWLSGTVGIPSVSSLCWQHSVDDMLMAQCLFGRGRARAALSLRAKGIACPLLEHGVFGGGRHGIAACLLSQKISPLLINLPGLQLYRTFYVGVSSLPHLLKRRQTNIPCPLLFSIGPPLAKRKRQNGRQHARKGRRNMAWRWHGRVAAEGNGRERAGRCLQSSSSKRKRKRKT